MVRYGLQLTSVPFFRLLPPLCLGVSIPVKCFFVQPLSATILLLLFVFILLIFKKISFFYQPLWGILLMLVLFFLGFIRARDQTTVFRHLPGQQYFVVLDDYPVEKEKTYMAVGQMVNSDLKIITYLSKSQPVRLAKPGDILCFNGTPELIENEGNPFEFDYRGYLNSKKIGYRIFLKEDRYHLLNGFRKLNIRRGALIFRKKLIENLYRSGINDKKCSPCIIHLLWCQRRCR